MRYISTRGEAASLGFVDVCLAGLASDGGLYVPEEIVKFTPQQIAAMQGLSYTELMYKVIYPFVNSEIEDADLKNLIEKSYKDFRHNAIAPLVQIENNHFILELFHGPTMAFKDFALQFLGNVFDYILKKKNQDVVIVGATSGDTGSAAIYGCSGSKNIKTFILHPFEKVSEVQRKQMTTVIKDNVFNIAVRGNFDDCQRIVKSILKNDQAISGHKVSAINSINWCRILAQIVYYFYAALNLGAPAKSVSFAVPTGNFGDIYAGYIAKMMGLPIDKLIIATNKNDILHRFFANNDYSMGDVYHTVAPSMDIQLASNFERFLFNLYDGDSGRVAELMESVTKGGKISVSDTLLVKAKDIFSSFSVNDDDICKTIKSVYHESGYLSDPHTATAINAVNHLAANEQDGVVVSLATAHPSKFSDAIVKSGLAAPALPDYLKDLPNLEEKYYVIDNDLDQITSYINKSLAN